MPSALIYKSPGTVVIAIEDLKRPSCRTSSCRWKSSSSLTKTYKAHRITHLWRLRIWKKLQVFTHLSLQSPFHSPLPQGFHKRTRFTSCPPLITWPTTAKRRYICINSWGPSHRSRIPTSKKSSWADFNQSKLGMSRLNLCDTDRAGPRMSSQTWQDSSSPVEASLDECSFAQSNQLADEMYQFIKATWKISMQAFEEVHLKTSQLMKEIKL